MQNKRAYTGFDLHTIVHAIKETRPPLIEGFVHERGITLLSSDPGAGKSTLTACWMAQASIGIPVFGELFVPRPLVIYYIPFERGYEEIAERLKHIETIIPIEYENLFVNDNFMGMNVIKEKHADEIIGTIRADIGTRHIDIIILDPIYACVLGGLSKDEPASAFCQFSSRLQNEFKCAIYLNHHTTKTSYDQQTGTAIEKDDPFYGSQWLKAHCTGAFLLKRVGEGTQIIKKKDSHSCLLKQINLHYEAETYSFSMEKGADSMPIKDRLIALHRTLRTNLKSVTFREIQGCLMGVSDSYLRHLLSTPPQSDLFKKFKMSDGRTLYRAEGQI